jgi:hypothetical protein
MPTRTLHDRAMSISGLATSTCRGTGARSNATDDVVPTCSRLSCGVGGTQLGNVDQSLRWRELPRSSADPEMIRRRPIQQNHCSLCAATQSGPHGHVRFAEIRAKKAMSGVEGLARADRLGMQGVGWGVSSQVRHGSARPSFRSRSRAKKPLRTQGNALFCAESCLRCAR